MTSLHPERMRDVAGDIDFELARLDQVVADTALASAALKAHPDVARWLRESIALKLHNFYTGCERIFQIIAGELNGGAPTGADGHLRLLERMATARDRRIAVVDGDTARALQPYLGFRHVVRNIYGFELDATRLAQLAEGVPSAHERFRLDLRRFSAWRRETAGQE